MEERGPSITQARCGDVRREQARARAQAVLGRAERGATTVARRLRAVTGGTVERLHGAASGTARALRRHPAVTLLTGFVAGLVVGASFTRPRTEDIA